VRDIRKVAVIGAGIAGLACAFRLQQLGIRPLILEVGAKAGARPKKKKVARGD
jgi:flavin-dependent dehydrogenase